MTLEEAIAKIKPLVTMQWRLHRKDGTVLRNHCILLENWRLF